jgi:glycosyltransferase involved in cell wall biosynthesis
MFLVSVIIPMYNGAEFINETLDSVLGQSYKNIEVIVIDDHSTDNGFELVNNINTPNLIIVKNSGKGACAARNYGFELSKGEYIQYLDADDLLSANKIEEQLKLAKLYNVSHIYSCGFVRFSDNIDELVWQRQYVDKDYDNPKMWLLDSWKGKGMGAIHNWLIPRDLIELAGPWDEELLINQDGEFISRVLFNARGVKFTENVQVYYRSGIPNSITQNRSFSKEKAASILRSYVSYKETSIKHNSLELMKVGLGYNFLFFIYQYSAHFPELTDKAKKEFYNLGFNKMWPVGGRNFKKLSTVIGFERALKFKQFFHKITNK